MGLYGQKRRCNRRGSIKLSVAVRGSFYLRAISIHVSLYPLWYRVNSRRLFVQLSVHPATFALRYLRVSDPNRSGGEPQPLG